jgi:protein-S-isoprenylcysteine O-methyltransferase Ste14
MPFEAARAVPKNWWLRSRGLTGLLILAPFAIAALLSPPYAREGSWGDAQFDALGWIVFWVGAGLRWWATLYIGGRKGDGLVCEGPYSLCRNPLYCGTFLMGLALVVMLQSLTFAAGFALATCCYLLVTVPQEEQRLMRTLGEPYLEYCARVPRFFPRFSQYSTPATIAVNVRGITVEFWRAARWAWIPLAGELIAYLRISPWWPQPLLFP